MSLRSTLQNCIVGGVVHRYVGCDVVMLVADGCYVLHKSQHMLRRFEHGHWRGRVGRQIFGVSLDVCRQLLCDCGRCGAVLPLRSSVVEFSGAFNPIAIFLSMGTVRKEVSDRIIIFVWKRVHKAAPVIINVKENS